MSLRELQQRLFDSPWPHYTNSGLPVTTIWLALENTLDRSKINGGPTPKLSTSNVCDIEMSFSTWLNKPYELIF